MIAIQTKYLPPTNSRGSRIKAWTCNGHAAIVPFDYGLSHEALHFVAVKALIKKHQLDWNTKQMRYGGTGSGYVFCFADSIVSESEAAE